MEIIQVVGASKSFDGSFRLRPLNLRMAPGEILGVMGPKGAGKSTLLRLLWGFLRPDTGIIRVFGMQPHFQQIEVRSKAGYLSAGARYYPALTPHEFLNFIASFYSGWDYAYTADLLDRFRISSNERAGNLSRELRVKLGLIAALGHHPSLLILDEPFSDLDPFVRSEILTFLTELSRESHTSILLSAQVSDDLDQIADSVLMLQQGQAVEYAQAAQLFAKYGQDRLEAIFSNAIGAQHHP